MTDLIQKETIKRAYRKVEEMAEKHSMTFDEWVDYCDRKRHAENLTDYEVKLIWAYQIHSAMEKLIANGKDKTARLLEIDNYWIRHYKKDFHNTDKAMKRLTDICSLLKSKFDIEYEYNWLIEYDEELYDKLKNERKRGIPGRNY
jgi:hypothetical protein